MADKTGKEFDPEIRAVLERLCLEYQGLKHLAKHYMHNENPKILLSEYCSQTANVSRVSLLFDGMSEALQSLPSDPLIKALQAARQQVTL
jgi:hypothetical protein